MERSGKRDEEEEGEERRGEGRKEKEGEEKHRSILGNLDSGSGPTFVIMKKAVSMLDPS